MYVTTKGAFGICFFVASFLGRILAFCWICSAFNHLLVLFDFNACCVCGSVVVSLVDELWIFDVGKCMCFVILGVYLPKRKSAWFFYSSSDPSTSLDVAFEAAIPTGGQSSYRA
ncbi:hypothetical protein QVD17_19470 [Tagetes erecta]|uniref:Uncharacterized protein n=1 Tax=Tagetes erecta TaxID=13708 RepID=A0AAD8KPS7_TARER|nr:hypothetical protein QVD17_19470 [Tagetes erecta]